MGGANHVSYPYFAAVFDVNGTIVDDARYQREAWKTLCSRLGMHLTDEDYKQHVAGHERADVLEYLFGPEADSERLEAYVKEKQRIYREKFGPVMKEVTGLTQWLDELRFHGVPIVVATSASESTVDFILDSLNLRSFFQGIIRATDVPRGKPAPDIFLRAAEVVGMEPRMCVVFEDSLVGVEGAKAAGMRCVGLATSLSTDELASRGADLAIRDYTELSYKILCSLFDSSSSMRCA